LDISDIIIHVKYEDGLECDVTLNNDFRGVYDFSSAGKKSVFAIYNGEEIHFEVNVDERPEQYDPEAEGGCRNASSVFWTGIVPLAFVFRRKERAARQAV